MDFDAERKWAQTEIGRALNKYVRCIEAYWIKYAEVPTATEQLQELDIAMHIARKDLLKLIRGW